MEAYFSNQPTAVTKKRLTGIVIWGTLLSIAGIAGAAVAAQSALAAIHTGAVSVRLGPLALFDVFKQPSSQGFVLQFGWRVGLLIWIVLAYILTALLVEGMLRRSCRSHSL